MAKKTAKSLAQHRLKQSLKKRARDKVRHKAKSTSVVTENAIQHQILHEFGNAQNFMRNILHLSRLMREDADLKALRFDADKVYSYFDLTQDRAALADVYAQAEETAAFSEEYEEFWRGKKRLILKDLVTKEFAEHCGKVFKKLVVTKKGFKKDFRAVLAGNLLVQSHSVALSPSEAPLEDNNLWELVLLATIKENQRPLPEPAPAESATEPLPPA